MADRLQASRDRIKKDSSYFPTPSDLEWAYLLGVIDKYKEAAITHCWTSVAEMNWACGHTGRGYCLQCHEQQKEAANATIANLNAKIEGLETVIADSSRALLEQWLRANRQQEFVEAAREILLQCNEFGNICYQIDEACDNLQKALAEMEAT